MTVAITAAHPEIYDDDGYTVAASKKGFYRTEHADSVSSGEFRGRRLKSGPDSRLDEPWRARFLYRMAKRHQCRNYYLALCE